MKEHEPQLKSSTLKWAELYLDRGFSVIPVCPNAKTPAVPWKEYQQRKPAND